MSKVETSAELANSILKDLFYKILSIQEKSIEDITEGSLTITEIHVLEIVGDGKADNISSAASELGVMVSSASICIDRMVKKGLLDRERDPVDRRVVHISLTEKGRIYYYAHQKFHREMVRAVLEDFELDKHPELVQILTSLRDFFLNKYKEYLK